MIVDTGRFIDKTFSQVNREFLNKSIKQYACNISCTVYLSYTTRSKKSIKRRLLMV